MNTERNDTYIFLVVTKFFNKSFQLSRIRKLDHNGIGQTTSIGKAVRSTDWTSHVEGVVKADIGEKLNLSNKIYPFIPYNACTNMLRYFKCFTTLVLTTYLNMQVR